MQQRKVEKTTKKRIKARRARQLMLTLIKSSSSRPSGRSFRRTLTREHSTRKLASSKFSSHCHLLRRMRKVTFCHRSPRTSAMAA